MNNGDQIHLPGSLDHPDPAVLGPGALPVVARRSPAPAEVDLPVPAPMPNVATLLVSLRRCYKPILLAGPVLAGLVAVGAWFLIPPPKYTVRAMLQVASTAPKVIFKTEELRPDFATYQRTQLTLLKSRNLLEKALNDPKVGKLPIVLGHADPVPWLEKQVQADYIGEVLRISMSGDRTDDLAVLVNAVTDTYLKEVVEAESKERWARRDELKKIYDEYQTKLEQRRTDLKKLTQKVGSKDKQAIRYAQELAMERMSTARRELIQSQSELRRAKAELEIRAAQGRAEVVSAEAASEAAIQAWIDDDQHVQKLRERIGQLKKSADVASRIARDAANEPAVQVKKAELDSSRKALAARIATLRPQAQERLRFDPAGGDPGMQALRERVDILQQVVAVTQAVFDAQVAESQGISQDTLYIDAILDEIGHADNAAKRIGEELEALSVELRAPSRVRSIEKADTPRKEEDKRAMMAGAGGVGTFALFALGMMLLDFKSRRIGSIEEVSRDAGLRVVGALPPLARPRGRHRRALGGPALGDDGLFVESIDSIRTMLLHSTGGRPLGSIMVTSACGGEGKTSLACHLATSLARSGLRTLLIDCDLRKPSIHRLFDIPPSPGFSEYLRGEAGPGAVIRPTMADGPDVIAAGSCDARTLRALARADAGAIFDEFRGSHDIIVVDTSPILPVTDGLLVGRHVDAAVYSVLRDISRIPWTHTALERLRAVDVWVLGAVVTGVRPSMYGAYFGGYYGTPYGGSRDA
jgi:polysaccharide biosynthesis transport protein